jgi:hypothetical protein
MIKTLIEKINSLPLLKKIIIIILFLGMLGSIALLFGSVRNLVITAAENIVFQRAFANPDKHHQTLITVSFIGILIFSFMFSKTIRIKRIEIWDWLSFIVIYLFTLIGSIYAVQNTHFKGEADSYILATIAIEQHGSLDIREGDIHQLELEEYSDNHVDRAKNNFNTRYPKDFQGRQYPWYMGTYSISVMPIRAINKILNLPQTSSHQLGNVLYYALALLVVYFCFKQTRKNVFLCIILLAFSPTFVYVTWASAEVFICSLVIVSLVFFTNGNKHLAALFMSLASTLNITICGFALVIIADYLITIYNDKKGTGDKVNLLNVIKQNWKNIIWLVVCFTPALIMPFWNLYHYHLIIPMLSGDITVSIFNVFWIKRFFSYLFDLNLGFLPYFPILLILFFIMALTGIYKKSRQIIVLTLGFFIVVFLYSAMYHINCGMTAMSRYNSWSVPFLVFTVTSQLNVLFKNIKTQRIIFLSLIISAGATLMITKRAMDYNGGHYIYFTPMANFFLDNMPALYNAYPFTFISRNEHYDGGYDYYADHPFIYYSKNGYARKILIPPECNDPSVFLDFYLASSNDTDMVWLKEYAKNIKNKHNKDWVYLNISSGRKFTRNHIIGIKYWSTPSELSRYSGMEIPIFTLIEGKGFELSTDTWFYSELVSIKPDTYYFVVLDFDTLPSKKTFLSLDLYDTVSDSLNHVPKTLSLNSKHLELLLYSGDSKAFLGEQYLSVFSPFLKQPIKILQLSMYELECDKISNSAYIPFYNKWAKLDF